MPPQKSQAATKEEEILNFWQDNKIFEKTLAKPAPQGDFVFYDGPPFATGLPHFGHILPTTIKDLIPRYKTMQGFRVDRKWGWDCHGLPIENLIEKELGLNNKRDIEQYGVEKFNAAARSSVLRYAEEWKKIIPRLGRWVDMKNDYRTMDSSYTESVWWSFKELFKKNRIYQSFMVMQYCPRCGTSLSNFEVNQGYKDITDISVYPKFELVDEPGTYLLAWTTTPWTLPGNVAIAINPEIKYVKVTAEGGNYVLAKERLAQTFKDQKYEILEEVEASDLLGKSYKPLFDYYQNTSLKDETGKEGAETRGWKIYAAEFVTIDEGTGIVHMAPAFGDEDFRLSKKEGLPFIQHVDQAGRFKPEVKDFAGELAKPKGDHQKADIEIIKYLAHHNFLFAKEKIIHSYPHCWRCETPLLNYATSSWFLQVTQFKDALVKANEKIRWVPKSIGENRFGKWLEGARDWAISRSRYWGAPIPVWKCQECEKVEVLGSVEDIKTKTKRNNYWILRHGESENNALNLVSTKVGNPHHLTSKGREQVSQAAKVLQSKNIQYIFSSDFVRTRETAELIKEELSLPTPIIYDERLREINTGVFDNQNLSAYLAFYKNVADRYILRPEQGENLVDVRTRVMNFIYEVDQKYEGQNILIVSHEDTLCSLRDGADGSSIEELKRGENWNTGLANGEPQSLDFAFIPHNENYELDFHRPFIDQVSWKCECGGEFKRVPEVFDVWYESGSMPYGKVHYPFKNKEDLTPADFIAEGLDQTRGWFYSLLVLNYELFGESPYKNVIVNGLVLAEDGRKMSKSLQNYPDLASTIDKFSADALRYFLIASSAVRAEEVAFSEKGLDEVTKKILNRLQNVISFYELYKKTDGKDVGVLNQSENVLDQWIIARLNQLNNEITTNLDKYELDRAARPVADFIDDLSTWYLRRSRERFKGEDEEDKNSALFTLRFVLNELAKLIAPLIPFTAEDIYQRVKIGAGKESVHLEDWPKVESKKLKEEEAILKEMEEVRNIVTLGLEARAKAGIKVRQPLGELKIKNRELKPEMFALVGEEVNVKIVKSDNSIDGEVWLDTALTPELKEEGQVRELMRVIQDLRKEKGLQVGEKAGLVVSTSRTGMELINKFHDEITRTANLKEILFEDTTSEEIFIADLPLKLLLR